MTPRRSGNNGASIWQRLLASQILYEVLHNSQIMRVYVLEVRGFVQSVLHNEAQTVQRH